MAKEKEEESIEIENTSRIPEVLRNKATTRSQSGHQIPRKSNHPEEQEESRLTVESQGPERQEEMNTRASFDRKRARRERRQKSKERVD